MDRSASKLRALLIAICFGLSFGLSCGGASIGKGAKAKATAILIIRCELKDAEVWVNSRYSRSAGEFARGLRLRPGEYRVEVRKSGYHSMYYVLSLAAEERKTLYVELAPEFR